MHLSPKRGVYLALVCWGGIAPALFARKAQDARFDGSLPVEFWVGLGVALAWGAMGGAIFGRESPRAGAVAGAAAGALVMPVFTYTLGDDQRKPLAVAAILAAPLVAVVIYWWLANLWPGEPPPDEA